LAYRIIDSGAVGGITVSPFDLQEGAKKVAAAANVVHVTLDADSTSEEYALKFLNNIFVGMRETASATDSVSAILQDANGNII
jgi:hypothetical protein